MDNLTPEQRRKNMQAIRSTETSIEVKLRKALWNKGYRYRKNYKKLPGKPDVVFPSKKLAVFCDSEFFHGYQWKKNKQKIKSNRDYWIPKIESNMKRDKFNRAKLKKEGWTVLRFWSRQIHKDLEGCIKQIEACL